MRDHCDAPTHLSIFAVPGLNSVNLGHGTSSQCGSWATAHRKLPEEKRNHVSVIIQLYCEVYFYFDSCNGENKNQTSPLTWGTHGCQFHWTSPWAEQISSCVCWWRPWQGSRIHQCPERTPGPSELQPQPTASWQRDSGLLVTVVLSHSNNNPRLVSHPYPHIFFLYFSDIFVITSR